MRGSRGERSRLPRSVDESRAGARRRTGRGRSGAGVHTAARRLPGAGVLTVARRPFA
jgi:hypothetical protein